MMKKQEGLTSLSGYRCTWLLNVCVLAQPSPDNDEITAFYALESQCIIM